MKTRPSRTELAGWTMILHPGRMGPTSSGSDAPVSDRVAAADRVRRPLRQRRLNACLALTHQQGADGQRSANIPRLRPDLLEAHSKATTFPICSLCPLHRPRMIDAWRTAEVRSVLGLTRQVGHGSQRRLVVARRRGLRRLGRRCSSCTSGRRYAAGRPHCGARRTNRAA